MRHLVFSLYRRLVVDHPRVWLVLLVLVTAFAAYQAQDFRLDASADSLTLETDEDLEFYREVSERYGGGEFLIITFKPEDVPLFSREALERMAGLQESLAEVDRVSSLYSMLDVPLLFSPRMEFAQLAGKLRTIRDPGVELELAKEEFTERNTIYRNLLVNTDGDTAAILMSLARDSRYFDLLQQRETLREQRRAGELGRDGRRELARLEEKVSEYNALRQRRDAERISQIRSIMDDYRDNNRLFLGGASMITSDVIDFIRSDLQIFGVGVALFLILALFVIFRRPRWIVIPMLCCATTSVWMLGLLGLMDWKVTVISSNFISLLLIITMSMTIHLMVRYRELHEKNPRADQYWLVSETLARMARPITFTALTTMVAFSSLVVSDIRPVIDFGWMMTAGIGVALVVCFTLFPTLLLHLKPLEPQKLRDFTRRSTLALSALTGRFTVTLVIAVTVITAVSLGGISRLTVENRFIDYFQKDTEIYQGMLEIDRELGGTTPLDIIINAPKEARQHGNAGAGAPVSDDPFGDPFADEPPADNDDPFDDPFADPFDDEPGNDDAAERVSLQDSYWFTPDRLEKLVRVQEYLESLPETGKVLSIGSTYRVAREINQGPLSYMELMLLASFVPDNVRNQLMRPYLSPDGNQARISIRMIDSDPNLERNKLLQKIERELVEKFDFAPEQVHLTGAMVLYNNMLQSLFDSQIATLGFVFLAILGMFLVLFRTLSLPLIAMLPNLCSAAFILGLMGWIGLPLDMMTITIAAITIGIAVDDTIHYTHRFREEFPKDRDYRAAMRRCHGSIGTAIYYTSLTIIVGFSILAFSNFNPTVYFGLLTGLAMAVALLFNLTLLPALMILLKPRIPELK